MATISSLFFLFSYGIVNTACFAMCISSTPSFRPTFRFYSTYTGTCVRCHVSANAATHKLPLAQHSAACSCVCSHAS